jgi:hypothetical protein
MESYIYDTLKTDNPEKFMNSFGKVFERYFHNGLDYSGAIYLKEDEIKRQLPHGVSVVDFVLKADESNIFIDAKGVELPYLGKVSDNPKVIIGKVKTSALKAIKQANVLNEHLLTAGLNNLRFKPINYLLVVTYSELYLGNGTSFYNSIAKDEIDKITRNISQDAKIPLENIYFLSLESFDLLCSAVKSSDLTFDDVLERAIKNDKSQATKKFDFLQHLHSLGLKLERPDYLDEPINELTEVMR